MTTPTARILAESAVAEATETWDARAEYRRLDALAEQLKAEIATPSVLADRAAVAARKAEIFRHYFSSNPATPEAVHA